MMSVEAEAILQKALTLSIDERRALARALLNEDAPKRRSVKNAKAFKELPDVPPIKNLDDAYAEAITYFKGIAAPAPK